MIASPGKSRRIVAVAMTAWLVLFYVSIHAIHRHAAVPEHACETLTTEPGGGDTAASFSTVCLVCLLLSKNAADPRLIPPAPVPGNDNTGFIHCDPPPVGAGVCCFTAAPRAPPC